MERYQNYARQLDNPGQVINAATITVYNLGTLVEATIYADDLPTPTPRLNPFLSDEFGFYFFYATDGHYDVRVSGGTPAVTPYTLGDIVLGADTVQVPSYTFAGLPPTDPAQAGRLARVTDTTRGLWIDVGTSWVSVESGCANVMNFGAKGDDTTDDTAAFQAAIDACQGGAGLSDGGGNTVRLPRPPVRYRIAGRLQFPSQAYRGIMFEGMSQEGCRMRFTAPGSGITSNAPQTVFRNVFFYGDGPNGFGVANNGLLIANAEECMLDNVRIYNFAQSCVELDGAHIGRMVNNTSLAVAPTLLKLNNTSAFSIYGGNFFQLVGSTAAISFTRNNGAFAMTGTWIEGFQRLLDFDNAVGASFCSMITLNQCRLLSTFHNARLLRVRSTGGSGVTMRLIPVGFRDCAALLLDTDYACEIALTGNTDPNSGVGILTSNLAFDVPPSLGLVTSDHASTHLVQEHVVGIPDALTSYLAGLGAVVGASGGGQFGYADVLTLRGVGVLPLKDGVIAPTTVAGQAQQYVDVGDGDLKIRFGDGTTRTIALD